MKTHVKLVASVMTMVNNRNNIAAIAATYS